jgi:hypothetical protein
MLPWLAKARHAFGFQNVALEREEVVTSNDKPRIVAYRYIIEASIDVSERHAQAVA